MTDQAVITGTPGTTVLGGNHDRDNHSHVITEAIGNASQHVLNALMLSQRETSASTTAISAQVHEVRDTVREDGNGTRNLIKDEARHLDGKICELERVVMGVKEEVVKQSTDIRFSLDAQERRHLEQKVATLELKTILGSAGILVK